MSASLRPAPSGGASTRGPRSLHYASSQIWTKGEDLVVTLAGVPWPSASGGGAHSPPPPPPTQPPTKSSASAYSVATGVHPHSPHVYSLFAVFDGHAGSAAARHCAREVAGAVHAALPPGDPPPSEREGCGCDACLGLAGPPPPDVAAGANGLAGGGTPAVEGGGEAAADAGGAADPPPSEPEDPALAAAAWRGGLARALTAAIHALHLSWAAHGRSGGCTATLVLQAGRLVTVANVGDSHAALDLPGGGGVLALTGDHRVDGNAREAARVRAAGGRVTNVCRSGRGPAADPRSGVGPLRVWAADGGQACDAKTGGGVANARVVGDLDLPPGLLVPSPSVAQVRLPHEGGRLLLASDGVWDALGMGRVARAARPHAAPEAADAVIAAILAAQGHEPKDDASVVVVDLLPPGVPSFPEATGRKLRRSASRAAALAVAGSPDSSSLGAFEAGGSGRGGGGFLAGGSRHHRPSTDEGADDAAAATAAELAAAAEAAAASGRFGAGAPKDEGEVSGHFRRRRAGGGVFCCARPPATAGEESDDGGGLAATATTAAAARPSPATSPPRRLTRDFTMHGGRSFGRGSGDGGVDGGSAAVEPSVRAGALFHGGGGSGRAGGFFADLSTRGGSAFFGGSTAANANGTATPRARADILVRLDVAVELGQLPAVPAAGAGAPAAPVAGGSGHGGGRFSLLSGGSGGDTASEPASAEGTAHGGGSIPAAVASWLDEELKAALLATQEDAARLHAAASVGRSASPVGGRRAARARAAAAVSGGPLAAALARARAAEAAAAVAAGRGEPRPPAASA